MRRQKRDECGFFHIIQVCTNTNCMRSAVLTDAADKEAGPLQRRRDDLTMDLHEYIASIPGFPKEGIIFRDITPILEEPAVFQEVSKQIADFAREVKADLIIAPESRGFIFGVPAALEAGLPFAPVRKPGKLPRETISESFTLEYGTDTLEMHTDAVKPGQRVLVVDDLLATGGTVEAAKKMVERLGGEVAGYAFVIELDDLNGRSRLGSDIPVLSLTHFEGD